MTLIQRINSFLGKNSSEPIPGTTPVATDQFFALPPFAIPEFTELLPAVSTIQLQPLPDWLSDEDALRDEGVLFGLSDARPDPKVGQIRAFFANQAAPVSASIEHHTEQIGTLNLRIEQLENRLNTLRSQLTDLNDSQPVATNLARHLVSLVLSIGLGVGAFYLVSDTLRPAFPNPWIAAGVFLAGMFNLFGRTSFFYETGTPLTGRRLIEEVGLPLATSLFVLVQALQTQSVSQATGLFFLILFVFLLSGKLMLSTLSVVQGELDIIRKNRGLAASKQRNQPLWESQAAQLEQQIVTIRTKKWAIVKALNHAETNLTQLNTQRDKLVNLFLGEFELARSLRERLTEQQRKLIMND